MLTLRIGKWTEKLRIVKWNNWNGFTDNFPLEFFWIYPEKIGISETSAFLPLVKRKANFTLFLTFRMSRFTIKFVIFNWWFKFLSVSLVIKFWNQKFIQKLKDKIKSQTEISESQKSLHLAKFNDQNENKSYGIHKSTLDTTKTFIPSAKINSSWF